MKTIYLLLTKSTTTVSRMIYRVTEEPYTHASISFAEELAPFYSFARRYRFTPLPGGLVTENLQKGYYQRHGDIPCALYLLHVSEESYRRAAGQVAAMMREQRKYRFNVLGLLLCRFRISRSRSYRFFCSEFVATVLQNSGAITLPKHPGLMHPFDFSLLPEVELCYEGTVRELEQKVRFGLLYAAPCLSEEPVPLSVTPGGDLF